MNQPEATHAGTSLSYAAYGLLGLPLAMAALPVYVQIPSYYTTQLGMSLASVGWVLFLSRCLDAFQDPLLGHYVDHLSGSLTRWFILSGTLLAGALMGLWLPPVSANLLPVWLGFMLVLAYLAHSMLNIPYLAWGARISHSDSSALLGAAAWREGIGLIGVILASVLPPLILTGKDSSIWLFWYNLGFAVLLGVAIYVLLAEAPPWQRAPVVTVRHDPSLRRTRDDLVKQWRIIRENRQFRRLLLPYLLNAISVSVPATLIMFFINDRLHAGTYAPAFFVTYFTAAAIGLPGWVRVANRIGVARAWQTGMALAIVAFVGSTMLGDGQASAFFVICAASGLALGADLALPPVLLAEAIEGDPAPSVYYGIWTLMGKLALAISGLALPLLAWLGYEPGQGAGVQLASVYAAVPCLLKLTAFVLLMLAQPARNLREVQP